MTKKELKEKIIAWCEKNGVKRKDIKNILHIHIHCYVVGYVAPACIAIARPWIESVSHLQKFNKENPFETVNKFDANLKATDWCIYAFICTEYSSSPVAISHETIFGKVK